VSKLLLAFTVSCAPVPKQRARMGAAGHWYTPTATVAYERAVIQHARYIEVPHEPFDTRPIEWEPRPGLKRLYDASRIVIRARFFFATSRRADIDNVQKAIGDALVRGEIIRDDSHTVLVGWDVSSGVDRRNPRAEIEIRVAPPPRPPIAAPQPKRQAELVFVPERIEEIF
jgi:Holliday junction resolvase RusA-like endonuclease